ncbi:TfuA-like protein [Mesorhizobium xinjiangense]|uniref:TfuA-like protein n=1 Tax=Mesorhizobium xinjiangense TaxID=2678685 RepID=UPI0012EE92E3|nr:TfuA-like protein [Mesorhizobium xinjiangense]
MNDFVVFLGPSLPRDEAAAIAAFDYRPPAAQGDIYRAVRGGARAIGLVDGHFEGVPAVWHKEILHALSRGVHVFGASSMGALRAAELAPYGMRGVGRIAEWYAAGAIDADDEVALVHAPAEMGHVALSLPLVNVRATLDEAVETALIDAGTAGHILQVARGFHFKQRSWKAVLGAVELPEKTARTFGAWLHTHAVDQKRLDAEALIAAMADLARDWPGPHRADFAFEPTDAWLAGVEYFEAASGVSHFDRRVIDAARRDVARFELILARAAAALLAGGDGAAPPPRARRLDRFRLERGLTDRAAYQAWLGDNELDEAGLGRLLAARDAVASLAGRDGAALEAALIGEIKLDGIYAPLAEQARQKEARLNQAGAELAAHDIAPRRAVEWYFEQKLGRPAPDDLEDARRMLALPDIESLYEMAMEEYLLSSGSFPTFASHLYRP